MRTAATLICLAIGASGHGYMTEPPSRQFEAYEANGWPNEVAEYDPHGVAAGGMYAECDGCSSREWYGPNPWSAPGTARAVDFVMGGAGDNILGVCGASPSRDNDYNQPLPGHWGTEAKTTYKAGDIIDVAWCVSADHGGVPQFRLCDDEGLVSAVTTPGYEPTVADHEALEQCFQRGLLRCDGVDSNTCDQVAECDTYAKDWEACADPGKYLHYDAVIESSLQYIPASKMVIGFEPGPQAYTGVSGGVEHEKAIISYLNGKVGGIMFWAVNEGASGGPNGNGQTTGANSVALANYAAAL